jgi:hypothetical protein
MATPIYDGHGSVNGQDNGTNPSSISSNISAKAVNRAFRGGRNTTRPPYWHIPFEESEEISEQLYILKYGNFQGWMPYKKKQAGRTEGVLVSIGGRIFFLTLVNERFHAELLIEGNDPKLMHAWFVQAREWAYIQDGKNNPILWDGGENLRRSNPNADELPIGTIMVYGHGRVFVTNAFDQIAASDIIYGNGLTDATATHKFTENKYWAGGGYFGQPTDIGEITGAIVMPRLLNNLNGQGEILFMSRDGASAIEASIPREQWQTAKVHTMTMNGRGCVAHDSLIAINNDCWFRSDDGYASYRLSKSEGNEWTLSKVSRFVNEWMNRDTEWLTQFNSAVFFDNRLIGSTTPEISAPRYTEFGNHRYHKGAVVLDLDQPTTSGDVKLSWDGLWTGVRPCSYLKLGGRCFVFSHDTDGENRIYEIKKNGVDDRFEGKPVQTEWFYLTKQFAWESSQRTNAFEIKQLLGGDVWVSKVHNKIKFGVDYRPDNNPCWYRAMKETDYGSSFGDSYEFSLPRAERLYMQSPELKCTSTYPSNHGAVFQFMIYGKGYVEVDRFRVAVDIANDPVPMGGPCFKNDETKKIGIDCKIENDYGYSIVEASSR